MIRDLNDDQLKVETVETFSRRAKESRSGQNDLKYFNSSTK